MNSNELAFFHAPESVAVLGAEEDPWTFGGKPLRYLRESGYRGTVFPVAPDLPSVQGIRAFATVGDLPGVPEVAVIVVPEPQVPAAVAECAAAGVRGCVVFASGLGGLDDGGDSELQRRMRAAAGTGMRLVGPNAQGIANYANGAVLSPWGLSDEEPAGDGPVAIVSQSGAMCSMIYGVLRRRGIGVRYAHGIGGSLDITVSDLAVAVLSDPYIRLVLLYLEDIPDPATLEHAARLAAARRVPVVALIGGRSTAGQRAANSHTGALASEDRVLEAFLERAGIWRAKDTNELLSATELYLTVPPPSGPRLAIVSNSGATCVLAADAAADHALPVAAFSAATKTALAAVLPPTAMHDNPVDLMGLPMSDEGLLAKVLSPLASDHGVDACFLGLPVAGPAYDVARFVSDARHFLDSAGKPLVLAVPQPDIRAEFRRAGVVAFEEESAALSALARFLRHHERISAAAERTPLAISRARVAATRTLDEGDSLDLLAGLGIPVVPHTRCATASEAARAFDAFGGVPVVVKGCSRDATHKSELGLVRLNLRTREHVRAAATELLALLEKYEFTVDGVLVSPMAPGVRELMLGAHADPVFGPVVAVGAGGKYVEALPDVRLLLPPFTVAEATRAVSSLNCAPLLRGVRGEPPADVAAFAEMAVRLGDAILDNRSPVVSLDANPVVLGAAGQGGLVVDAVAVIDGE